MLEDRVSFAGSTIYEDEQSQYWSLQQSTVLPACRVTPRSAEDVAITIRVLKTWECQFAVKSGGHAAFAGASNIQDAVTIDLGGLNGIDVKSDRLQVSVGAGAKWSDVYPVTDKAKLGVVGGRVPGIGVGGLTLGGGLSFFAGRYGFACDNVVNYQVS
jgi:FAD/FMN-containing dehydrogenase